MDNKTLFQNIIDRPSEWLLDQKTVDDYKRALSVLLEENHDDPYAYLLEIIETEVKNRVSEKLFKITEYAAQNSDKLSKVCSECDVPIDKHGRYCETRKSDQDRAADSGH